MDGKCTALINGRIYTVSGDNWDKKPVDAIAFDAEGVIRAIGSIAVEKFVSDGDKIIDLNGKAVLPGFVDSHVHAPGIAFMKLFEVNLNGIHNKDDMIEKLNTFIEAHPDFDAYFAGGLDLSIRDDAGHEPCSAWLDEICPDKPLTIKSSDMHSRLLNTKSMEVSGITRDCSVEFGHIHRNEDGSLTGLFSDCRTLPIMEPEYSIAQHLEAIRTFVHKMNGWGYTSIMSIAPIMIFDPRRYIDLEKAGELSLRVNVSQMVLPEDIDGCIEQLRQLKGEFSESDIKVSTGKFLVDGVLEGKTACLKEPYSPDAGMGSEYYGKMNWDEADIKEATEKMIEAGFQSHYHCIGDAATTLVLDAIENGQKHTGNNDLRNVITHLQIVNKDDYHRFSELGVIAAIQPFWHFKEPGWFENIDEVVLGSERAEKEYPARSLADAGAVLTASGDYPVSPSNNPFHGIQAGVTRNIFNEEYDIVLEGPEDPRYLLGPEERLTLKQMVEAYTINGAHELFRENEIGTIEIGKRADLIVIDRDIFNIDVLNIHNTSIEATIFNGDVVYGSL